MQTLTSWADGCGCTCIKAAILSEKLESHLSQRATQKPHKFSPSHRFLSTKEFLDEAGDQANAYALSQKSACTYARASQVHTADHGADAYIVG